MQTLDERVRGKDQRWNWIGQVMQAFSYMDPLVPGSTMADQPEAKAPRKERLVLVLAPSLHNAGSLL